MFTPAMADRSDRDSDTSVGWGWEGGGSRADKEGKEGRRRRKDRQTEVSDICSRQLTTPG